MDDRHDLKLILESRVPIVLVNTHDETRFLEFLQGITAEASAEDYRPLFRWSVTDGLQRLDIDLEPQLHNAAPDQVLKHIRSVEQPGTYVLLDFHPYLQDPVHIRLLKDIALDSEDGSRTLILVSHDMELPVELERLAAHFTMSLPDEQERSTIVTKVIDEWNLENTGSVKIDRKAFDLLVRNLSGLTRPDPAGHRAAGAECHLPRWGHNS